ncbi:sigma-54-dependent Fis family transcriptional regulator [Enterocloster clostridioformis]|nr:sigma-54-dependent Fis family transcriptional regulator [Lachnoclostridium sp. YL32]NDO27002.1 AAA family ATPase [Enterocloster clostridioformis]OXE62556.1 sigma-54-dependent Fis family transcriptional regulator [Enterocloster clostridioformis]QQR04057.1 sigma 54-interacting transcriptional regulator [Enterocloster clostridioformis]
MPGLVVSFMNASRIQQMENQIRRQMSDKGLAARYTFQDIVHKSDIMDRTIENAGRYAGVSSNVLLVGETGTGKELFAQSIHNASKRAGNAFVAVNCAALPESLLESELFGYVEGAFTGSKKGGKMGLFEMAHKGTLFLDEIAEIPLTFQSKLLRVLQEREVRRVGGNSVISVDVRIIAATNKNLQRQVSEGKFRQDLLYRLNVLRLYIPPLRKRSEDIPLLFHYYLQYYSNQFGYEMPILSAGAEEIIEQYAFTGNIRELRNIAERLSVVHSGFMITEEEMAAALGQDDIEITEYSERPMTTGPSCMMYAEGKREQEKQYIQRLLSEHGYNRSETARAMGIDRSTLWRKMKKYGLQ